MNEKQSKIIETAIDVFSRYGVRRATMGDIAEQAGISRQTLYSLYTNKEQVMQAAISHVAEKVTREVVDAWAQQSSLSEKLDSYLELAVVNPYVAISQMPDSKDLLTGFSEEGMKELRKAESHKLVLLKEQFKPFEARLKANGTNASELAEFFENASTNFKYNATDKKHLMRLLKSLKASTLALTGEV